MTPDLSLLLAHFASETAPCGQESDPDTAMSPQTARIAAQIAHLSGEERRLLVLGDEVRERALALGQQRFEAWIRDNPEDVAACRAFVGRTRHGPVHRSAPRPGAAQRHGELARLS